MTTKWPNAMQVALLYDHAEPMPVDALISNFLKIEENARGYRYNMIETDGRGFARCYGGAGDVMVFVEWVDHPTDRAAFAQALTSAFNRTIGAPEAEEAIARHQGYLLLNVHHGALPQTPEIRALLGKLQMPEEGQSLETYLERQRVLGLLASLAVDVSAPTLAHWTYTDVLARPQPFHDMMLDTSPNFLTVHAMPYRPAGAKPDEETAGLRTFGAHHYIGREIHVRPSVVPWMTAYEHAIGFMRVALARNGYIIPDGDTFGDENHTFSYRVHHTCEPFRNGDVDIPCYELEPLLNVDAKLQSPDYAPRDRIVDIDRPQRQLGDFDSRSGKRLVAEWRQKRAMAEAAGATFEVRARGA